MGMRPVGAALVIGILAWPAAAASAPSQGFVLTGRLTGVSAPAGKSRRMASIRVVRVETAEVAAVRRLPRSMAYRVVLPPGPYVVVGTAADVPGSRRYDGVSRLVRAGARGHRRLDLRPTRQRSRAVAAGGPARTAEALRYVGVTPSMPVSGSSVPSRAIGWMLQTDIANTPCPGGKQLQLIEVEHRQRLLDEIKLSQSKGADPATRMTTARLISPRYMVRGGGTQSGGSIRMSLRMVDVKTGRSVAQASVSGPAGSFFELYNKLQRAFIADACKDDAPSSYSGTASGTQRITSTDQDTSETWTASGLVYVRNPASPDAQPWYDLTGGSVEYAVSGRYLGACRMAGSGTFALTPEAGGGGQIVYGRLGTYLANAMAVGTAAVQATITCPEVTLTAPFYLPIVLATSGSPDSRPDEQGVLSGTASLDEQAPGVTQSTEWHWTLSPQD